MKDQLAAVAAGYDLKGTRKEAEEGIGSCRQVHGTQTLFDVRSGSQWASCFPRTESLRSQVS